MKKTILSLFVAVGLIGSASAQATLVNASTTQRTQGVITGDNLHIGIPVSEFLQEEVADHAAFLSKYKGHEIVIRGNVSHIEKGTGSIEMVITINDPTNSSRSVKAEFPEGSVNQGNDLIVSNDGLFATIVERRQGTIVKKRKGLIMGEKPLINAGQVAVIKGLYKDTIAGAVVLTGCRFAGPRERNSERKK